jgi:hypothetical protein
MKILDNNALSFIRMNNIVPADTYVITPDVQMEFEDGFDEELPKEIRSFLEIRLVDFGLYLQNYSYMLNAYAANSFYNMRGFGDVSILALLHTLKKSTLGMLSFMVEETVVVTSDGKLIDHIRSEFSNKSNEFDSRLKVEPERLHFKS